MELLGFQEEALRWLKKRPKVILALEQGLGKTVVSAMDAEPPIVVVCTASMKYRWAEEIEKWRPDLKCQVIRDVREKIDWDCDVHIINYDILSRFQVPEPWTLIVDEAHKAKTPTAKRTKAVMAIARAVKRVRFLSGTPMLSRPVELFPMLSMLGVVSTNWDRFTKRYCAAWQTPWGSTDVSGASNLEELAGIVSPVMLRLTKAQVMPELPPKVYRVISFDGYITDQETKILEYHKRHLRLPPGPIAFQAITDIRRIHAEKKLPAAIRYIEETLEGMERKKLVVFAHHRASVEGIVAALKKYNPVFIMGGTKPKDAFNSVQAFQEDDRVQLFVGNLQAAGEGITLTAANHVIIAEPPWVPAEIDQAADRCHRIGTKSSVTVDLLVVQGSIDARMIRRAIEKQEVINQVIKETNMAKTPAPTIADLLREIGAALTRFADAHGTAPDDDPAVEDEPKPAARRGRKPAEEPDEDEPKPAARRGRKPAEEPEDEPKPAARRGRKPAEPEKPAEASLAEVRRAASKLIALRKRDVLAEILEDFDAEDIADLKAEDYEDFIKECMAEAEA